MNPHHRKGILYAALAFSAWGLLSPGNEILLRQMTPMWMQVLRAALAVAVVLAVTRRSGLRRALGILREPVMLRALLFGTVLSFGLFSYSQTRVPAVFTTLGFYTAPLWTALFARVALGETVGRSFFVAVAALLAGGYLALTGGGALPAPDALGLLLAVGSGAAWGVYAVLFRKHAADHDWKDLLLASMLLGLACFLVVAFASEPLPDLWTFTPQTWTWTVVQVLIPTLLALALFQSALRLAPAGHVNILVGFELAGTVLFAWLLLDATFSSVQLIGLAVALASVVGYLWLQARAALHDARRDERPHAE